jgi:hypothetical protein
VIRFTSKGDFKRTQKFLNAMTGNHIEHVLNQYGQKGVEALREATPKDTGRTADSWYYTLEISNGRYAIVWANSNINKYVNIAVIIQYGHGTRNGGWVEGRDYINPAMQPLFDELANKLWKEVTSV